MNTRDEFTVYESPVRFHENRIRAAAVSHGISCITTLEGATAAVGAMEALRTKEMTVQAVQDRFPSCRQVPVA